MRRLIATIALGCLLVADAGCGPTKGTTTPKEDQPIIPGGPQASDGGKAPGSGGKVDKNAPPGSGTAQ